MKVEIKSEAEELREEVGRLRAELATLRARLAAADELAKCVRQYFDVYLSNPSIFPTHRTRVDAIS